MNLDQLLAIVADLSAFTTTEQLEERLLQCRSAHEELKGSKHPTAISEPAKATLLYAIARIQNKIAAIHFSERREAQRALRAAAAIPQERFSATVARAHP
jgi:hypothetical protein